MKCSIIGCGETGALWDGSGYSIGVNDCWKFGKPTDCLVVVNSLSEDPARQQMVISSRPKDGFFTNLNRWAKHPNYRQMVLRSYSGGAVVTFPDSDPARCYHSTTSPFIAISLAANKGFKEIVLYGVDFVSHKVVKDKLLEREIKMYVKFITEFEKIGVKIYIYKNYGALADKVPV